MRSINLAFWSILGIFIMLMVLTGCMSAASSGADVIYNRYSLQNNVNNQLSGWKAQTALNNSPKLQSAHINATVFQNILLLTGQAPDTQIRLEAENLVQTIPHIDKVINKISINQPTSAQQRLEDTWLTTKISSQIITAAVLNPDNLKIVTENNTVYLLGTLPRHQAEAAIDIAKNTEGVDKVVTVLYFLDPKTS